MMKYMRRLTIWVILVLTALVDIPFVPVPLVSDAEAIMGVRRRTARRTAVVAYSAGAATTAAHQQAASPPPQQAATPPAQPQPATAPQSLSAIPVGTIVQSLPGKCVDVTVANVKYQECEGSYYRAAFQGNNLVYVVVDKPL